MALFGRQEVILHAGECAGLQRKAFDSRNPCRGTLACLRDEPSKRTQPPVFLGGCVRAEPSLDGRQQLHLESCEFAQRWDLIDAAKVAESILRGRQQCPRSEKRQLIEGVPALPGQGMCPPLCLALGVNIEAAHHLRGGCSYLAKVQPCRCEGSRPGSGCRYQIL